MAGIVASTHFGLTATESARVEHENEHLANAERRKAQGQAAASSFELGISLCEKGEVGRGILQLTRSLRLAPQGASDLQSAVRTNLASWGLELPRLHDVHLAESELLAVALSRNGEHLL